MDVNRQRDSLKCEVLQKRYTEGQMTFTDEGVRGEGIDVRFLAETKGLW